MFIFAWWPGRIGFVVYRVACHSFNIPRLNRCPEIVTIIAFSAHVVLWESDQHESFSPHTLFVTPPPTSISGSVNRLSVFQVIRRDCWRTWTGHVAFVHLFWREWQKNCCDRHPVTIGHQWINANRADCVKFTNMVFYISISEMSAFLSSCRWWLCSVLGIY